MPIRLLYLIVVGVFGWLRRSAVISPSTSSWPAGRPVLLPVGAENLLWVPKTRATVTYDEPLFMLLKYLGNLVERHPAMPGR